MNFKVSDLIDLNKIPMKIIIFLGIVSGIFVIASDSFFKVLKMTEFQKDYGKFFGPIFIASIAFIGLSIIYYIKDKLENQFNRNKGNKIIIEELESLDPSEQSVIREFSIQQKKSVKMPIDNSTVAGLINKGILKRVSNIGDGLYFPLALNKLVNKKLKETHLGVSSGMDEDEIGRIISNRPDWAKDYYYQEHYK